MNTRPSRKRTRRAGFSLVEVMIGFCVLSIAVGAVASTLVATTSLNVANEELSRALDGQISQLEELRSVDFEEVFASYNGIEADDPQGAGSAPGSDFDVPGMDAWAGAAAVGSIEFPGDGTELREDFVDRDLGMPRDLNGDGIIDGLDHSGDYIILPLRVTVRWSGRSGEVERSVVHALANH